MYGPHVDRMLMHMCAPLPQTPESMQMWVYNLRYIKAYWSRKHTRETVINEEQERKLLEKLLREEEDNKEVGGGGEGGGRRIIRRWEEGEVLRL